MGVMLPYDKVGSGPALVRLHARIADRTTWAEHLEPLAEAGRGLVRSFLTSRPEFVP